MLGMSRGVVLGVEETPSEMSALIQQSFEEHTKMAIVGSPRNGSKKVDGKAYSYLGTSQFNDSTLPSCCK